MVEDLEYRGGKLYSKSTGELLSGKRYDGPTWVDRLNAQREELLKSNERITSPVKLDYRDVSWRHDTALASFFEKNPVTPDDIKKTNPFLTEEQLMEHWQRFENTHKHATVFWQKLQDYGIVDKEGMVIPADTKSSSTANYRNPDALLDIKA